MTEHMPTTRRGVTLYQDNPFIGEASANTRRGSRKISDKSGTRMMVVADDTGEVMGPAGFWQYKEVDSTQFIKLYVNGVKAFKELSNAGARVFEVLYLSMQGSIGKDMVYLSFLAVDQKKTPLSESTYSRGMKELAAKSFIAPHVTPGWFFVNPDFLWNGDRLAFVREYRKAPTRSPDVLSNDDKKFLQATFEP